MDSDASDESTELRRVVQLEHRGQLFVFTVDQRPPLAFWTMSWNGCVWQLPARVTGDEQPDFFRSLADTALGGAGGGYIDVAG